MKGEKMPLYKYKCEPCGFDVEMIRSIKDRDNLTEIIENNCPLFFQEANQQFEHYTQTGQAPIVKPIIHDCKFRRVQVSGSFKI